MGANPRQIADSDAPGLGGDRRERDSRLWGALLGPHAERRIEAARTIRATEAERWYAQQVLATLPTLPAWQRAHAGDALALLGDPRFASRYLLSEMIRVPEGVAILGSSDFPDERPVHRVQVGAFALAQFPVTHAAYAVFVEATGFRKPGSWRRGRPAPEQANQPVTFVSARDAEAYCAWLSLDMGYRYRLPSEAEWVMAARGLEDTRVYPWGDDWTEGRANVWERAPHKRVCAVGLFPEGRGPFGHCDLAGNVWEWCSSLYWRYPYRADDGREDPGSGEPRVMHGGCWRSRALSVRCAARQGELPTDSFATVGFRLAWDE
jgi:iron(II)-dependent oxidoreductase